MKHREAGDKHKYDEWRHSILELPDELFFSIMRTYFGRLKTPFHKPRLVEKLAALLSEKSTIHKITALTDTYDAELLTAIEFLGEPDPGLLFGLFQGEKDYFSFHNHLINLQERLLIYSTPENHGLAINPYIHPELREKVITPRLLFPPEGSVSEKKDFKAGETREGSSQIYLNENLIFGLLSSVSHQRLSVKADGSLRKNTLENLRECFPNLFPNDDPSPLYWLLNSMHQLKLLQLKGGLLQFCRDELNTIIRSGRPLRNASLWAAAVLVKGSAGSSVVKQEGDIQKILQLARTLLQFLEIIPGNTLFSIAAMKRFFKIVWLRQRLPGEQQDERKDPFEHILHTLTELRILLCEADLIYLNPEIDSLLTSRNNDQPLLIHSDFSVTVQPPLNFRDGLFIALLMHIRSYGAYPQYELSAAAYIGGRSFFSPEQIRNTLIGLSGTSLPQNILVSLDAWEGSYTSVRMVEGITLILARHWDRLVRHHPDFESHVLADLGSGIYVMDQKSQSVWRSMLNDIGVSPLPPVRTGSEKKGDNVLRLPEPDSDPGLNNLDLHMEKNIDLSKLFPRSEDFKNRGEQVQRELMEELEKIGPPEGIYKEISTRIEKKLILLPAQLKYPLPEQTSSEARGIDYPAKVRIIQQSLQTDSSLLELVERTSRGKPVRHLIRPKELEKTGKDLTLIGDDLPSENPVRIRVEKIGYIKKWKGSLFIRPRDYTNS